MHHSRASLSPLCVSSANCSMRNPCPAKCTRLLLTTPAQKESIMKQSSRPARLAPQLHPCKNHKPASRWKRLPTPHQQTCRQLLSQLLQLVLRHEQHQITIGKEGDCHDREASA